MNTKQTAPAKASESESEWQKTPYSNLIRYVPSGTYFARIKVKGKLIRRSLKTKTLSVAKLRLSDLEKDERKKATRSSALLQGKMTFGDAVAAYKRQRKNDPNIKPGTVEYDDYRIKALLESWPELEKMDVSKITDSDCKSWSEKNAKKVSSSSHNHTVGILRRVFKIAIEAGARYDNPALAALWVKEHTNKQIKLPEPGQFEMLVKEIESSGSGFAESSAELVQFLAYGGFRKSEAANITWADCDFKRGKIILRGDPVTGLKRRRAGEFREVPMIPEMRKLLEQIQVKRPDEPQTEKVMRVSECKKSIATACKKLEIPRFTHHDLRHLFATRCIESGVDIPTVSRWLGHKDGGALAMKTYGHLRDEHSTTMAQKVVFSENPSNVISLPPPAIVQNGSASPDKKGIAQAKAKYNFPWWVSKNPMEVFWGQLNEETQIVPLEKLLDYAKQAMSREVFPEEFDDKDSLKEEFIERISQAAFVALTGKIQKKQADAVLKVN
ncbi:MAG: site-specific integrase [Verrucomicrobiota bacterium]|nr:site-specific integrase [Verrucomicrobiota bacterium]